MPGMFTLAVAGLRLEHLTPWQALALFAVPAAVVVTLGVRSMAGLGPSRKWVAIALRCLLIAVLVLVVAGLRLERRAEDVEVIVVRDVSLSTARVRDFPGPTLPASVDKFLAEASKAKKPEDRVGVVSFAQQALIESMPSAEAVTSAPVVRDVATGTDIAAALQLALATFDDSAMRRIVLLTDGNSTTGDLDSALNLAASQKIPIDVVPLRYDVRDEVLLDKLETPTWRRENEPFTLSVFLRSTSAAPVTGRLTVLHQGIPMVLGEGEVKARRVILRPGVNVERVRVPALRKPGVHEFRALFEPDDAADAGKVTAGTQAPGTGGGGGSGGSGGGQEASALSTGLLANRSASAFTFVQGRGQVLYVDNVPAGAGGFLAEALARQGIGITPENRISPDRFPTDLLQLQNYDVVILANVPRGMGGLSDDQQRVLAQYVHELGGGLVMIGGEQAFGAGGWQGSDLERVLPVDMDVPSRREVAKGALVLLMHSTEMPDGNYWGEQCAIKAVEALSARDEVGVLSFAWRGVASGSQWDFPLQVRGDGSKAVAAIKRMQLGDMPSFDDAFAVALKGRDGNPGLKDSDARQKHMIVISDGDPQIPNNALMAEYADAKITVSTVTVYPHDRSDSGLPPTMRQIAERLKGRAYGPVNDNPQQLPQIFIKEATVVKRSLIQEDAKGIALRQAPALTDAVRGISVPGTVTGFVLTSRKNSPQVEVPIVAGKENDPVLAYWQTGLGRSVIFTSDAHNRWAANWYASSIYDRFWAQVVRAVARPPMNTELDVQTVQSGERGKILVEAARKEGGFESFLNIRGSVVGPDGAAREVRLVQTGPGQYEAAFDTPVQGNYVVSLRYTSPDGRAGFLLSGLSRSASPELRDLSSRESILNDIARRTGGRVLPPFNAAANDWFTREGLAPMVSPLPIWDRLLPLALLLLLLDVTVRRVAIDRRMLRAGADKLLAYLRGFTHTTRGDLDRAGQSLDALRRTREQVASGATRPGDAPPPLTPNAPAQPAPLPTVEGDLSDLVGGASASDTAPAPKQPATDTKQDPADPVGGLLAAKRRAQQKIDEKKKG